MIKMTVNKEWSDKTSETASFIMSYDYSNFIELGGFITLNI